MFIGLHVKYTLFVSDSDVTSVFSTVFYKNTRISNFTKIGPLGAELFHAKESRTDTMNQIFALRNFGRHLNKLSLYNI